MESTGRMADSNPNDRVIKFFRLKELKTGGTIRLSGMSRAIATTPESNSKSKKDYGDPVSECARRAFVCGEIPCITDCV